jgi:predicted transcriptional regulator YdeE
MRVCRKKERKNRKFNTPKHTMSRNGRIFPQSSQYEYAEGVEFEVYPFADTTDPNYHCEIRVAVNEKGEQ